jgi:DNA-binding response OmpR family regulator
MRILIIEDEEKLASFLKRALTQERYVVDVALDGEKGMFLAEINPYDLILLDIILPGKDGIAICAELRHKKIDVPILMLTAKAQVRDKITGLQKGADDYLAKPFVLEELLARITCLLRRQRTDKTSLLKVADLKLDQLTHTVTRAGKEIILTAKEYSLLEYLMLHAGQIVTRSMISEHVWHEEFDSFTNVIDVYVNFLRHKIDKGFKKKLIRSKRGIGYMLAGER